MHAAVRTQAQNSAIYGALSQLSKASGLSREELAPTLEALCMRASGQPRSSRLNERQANDVIRELNVELAKYSLGVMPRGGRGTDAKPRPSPHNPWGPRGPGARTDQTITPFQQGVVTGLFELLGWSTEARSKFVLRQCKVPWPQTQAHADALIEPLKSMVMRRCTVGGLRDRAAALVTVADGGGLDAWKRGFVRELHTRLVAADDGDSLRKAHVTPLQIGKLMECEAAAGLATGSRSAS